MLKYTLAIKRDLIKFYVHRRCHREAQNEKTAQRQKPVLASQTSNVTITRSMRKEYETQKAKENKGNKKRISPTNTNTIIPAVAKKEIRKETPNRIYAAAIFVEKKTPIEPFLRQKKNADSSSIQHLNKGNVCTAWLNNLDGRDFIA